MMADATQDPDGLAARPTFLTPADVNALPSKPADHRLAYGGDPQQFGQGTIDR